MRDWPWYSFVVIVLIIFVLFYVLHFRPKSEELENIRTERIKTEAEVARLKEKKEQLEQIEEELKVLNVELKKLETIIPLQEEIDVILRRIQQLAYDARLNITNFVPRKSIDKEFYFEKPINIAISGNYHNLATFFSQLSKFERLFTIQNFTIKNLRDQSDTTTITANTTAQTYLFKEEEEEPPPTKKKTTRRKK